MQFVKIQNCESFVHMHTFSLNWMILPFCYHRQNLCRQNVILQKNRSLQWKVNLLLVFKRINLSSIRESSEVNYCKKKLRPGKGVFTTLIPDCWTLETRLGKMSVSGKLSLESENIRHLLELHNPSWQACGSIKLLVFYSHSFPLFWKIEEWNWCLCGNYISMKFCRSKILCKYLLQ